MQSLGQRYSGLCLVARNRHLVPLAHQLVF